MSHVLAINLFLMFFVVFSLENTIIIPTPRKGCQLVKHEMHANFNMNALNLFMHTGRTSKHLKAIEAIFEAIPDDATYNQFIAA